MRPIITDWVAWSVCRSVTLVSPAKTAALIELPFGLRTWVGFITVGLPRYSCCPHYLAVLQCETVQQFRLSWTVFSHILSEQRRLYFLTAVIFYLTKPFFPFSPEHSSVNLIGKWRLLNWFQYSFVVSNTHRRIHFTALFPGPPRWANARRNLLLDFMVQGKITEADTPTIQLGATPSGLTSDPPPSFPHFYAGCPSCRNPPTLSWLGTGIKYAGLHTSVAWFCLISK